MKLTVLQKAYKAKLITRQHTICNRLGVSNEERKEMLECNYGVSSSKDLHIDELKHFCKFLEGSKPMSPTEMRNQKQRRKLLALIYEFSKHGNYFCTTEIAIGIACIACGVQKFNNASEQKVIAAIKSFEAKEADAWVTAIFKKVTDI